MLDEAAVLAGWVQALQRQRSAQLTVAASLTVAGHLLPGWLGGFRRTSPDLHIGLNVVNSSRVCEACVPCGCRTTRPAPRPTCWHIPASQHAAPEPGGP